MMSYNKDHIPSYTVYADVIGVFVIVMCIAFGWQAMNAINLYAELRGNGQLADGRWTASYPDSMTGEEVVAYAFDVNGKTYRGSQSNPFASTSIQQGESVDIIYSVTNPKFSRIAGTEGYNLQNVIELILSLVIGIFAVQFLFAYHTKRSAWVFILHSLVTSHRNHTG